MIIRPIQGSDIFAMNCMAQESGVGLTSLPVDNVVLTSKIQKSIDSFNRPPSLLTGEELYLFILEDDDGEVLGISGIKAKRPSLTTYMDFYKYDEAGLHCHDLEGATEVCTLFLRPNVSQANAGKFLSRVRYVFMSNFLTRFSIKVIAEMRGVSDENGVSPFWECVKTSDISFDDMDNLLGTGLISNSEHKLSTHVPDNRISDEARDCIGVTHNDTVPARILLEREGFTYRDSISPLDGGPILECHLHNIKSIMEIQVYHTLIATNDQHLDTQAIVGNFELSQFRAILTDVSIHNNKAIISQEDLDRLNMNGTTAVCVLLLGARGV